MSRSIRARLDRLEKLHNGSDANTLPPQFWEAICGAVPVEQLDPKTRRLLSGLFGDGCEPQDPIEDATCIDTNGNSMAHIT
jgi:hypothetical protein